MKKSQYLIITAFLGLMFLLSACIPGPRVVGIPGITLSDDMVYVAYGQHVYGLDADNGSVQWYFPEEGDTNVVFYAKPLLSEDHLYVGDLAMNFHKLDINTGLAQWTFTGAQGFYIGQAAENDGTIFAPNNDGRLYAIDTNGELKWEFKTDHYIWAQPVIDGDMIFVGSMDHNIYALSLDGELIWSVPMAGAVVGTPVLSEDGGQLYSGSIGQDMAAINTADGSILWTFEADESIWGNPILIDDQLFFADSGGHLYAVDAATGDQVWRLRFTGSVVGGLTRIEDGFVLATSDGVLRAFTIDGSPKWEATLAGEIYQAPAANGEMLATGTIDGENLVYGFNLSGVQLWSTTPEK